MSTFACEFETDKAGMDELRPALEAALRRELPAGLMDIQWAGDELRLSGPGATGSVVCTDGRLRGEATLRLPASLMRPVIEEKMRTVLAEVAGAAVSQA